MVKRVKSFWEDLDAGVKRISTFIAAVTVIAGACAAAYSWASQKIVDTIDARVGDVQTQVMTASQKADSYAEEARVALARSELLNLIADYPDNVADVLKAAEYYFIELGGNYVAEQAFFDWASTHQIDIDYIKVKIGVKHG